MGSVFCCNIWPNRVFFVTNWVFASHSRDIWEVQGGWGGEDVLEVLGAGLFEAVQRAPTEVFGQALVLLTLPGELHRLVLWDGHTDHLTIQTLTVQMAHRLTNKPWYNVLKISFNPETHHITLLHWTNLSLTFEQQKLKHKIFFIQFFNKQILHTCPLPLNVTHFLSA